VKNKQQKTNLHFCNLQTKPPKRSLHPPTVESATHRSARGTCLRQRKGQLSILGGQRLDAHWMCLVWAIVSKGVQAVRARMQKVRAARAR
jgi:hypothetical protein